LFENSLSIKKKSLEIDHPSDATAFQLFVAAMFYYNLNEFLFIDKADII